MKYTREYIRDFHKIIRDFHKKIRQKSNFEIFEKRRQAASCEDEGFKRVKVEKFEVGKVRSWKRSKLEKIDVTKVRSSKCSKIIINVAYTNRPTLSF